VYSSILPYSKGLLANYKVDRKIKGEGIKPKRSVLGYINKRPDGARNSESEARDGFGDIRFDRVKCDYTARNDHLPEIKGIAVDFLVDRAIYFASIFTDASILIVLPSGYYRGPSFSDSLSEQTVQAKFYSLLSEKDLKNPKVKILFQPA